jgi:hypothetical protein
LSETEKIQRLQDLVNKTLGKQGVTAPTVQKGAASMTANGSFNPWQGKLNINPAAFQPGSAFPSGLAKTVYHESRHAEQFFHAAKGAANPSYVGSNAGSNLGSAVQQSVNGSGKAYRNDIYARKKPTNPNTADRKIAYKQYRGLAEEQDAFKVGDSTGDC